MSWISELVDDFYKFLREKTEIQEDALTEWHLVTTPFLGLFNDSIEIYIKRNGDKIILSDDGQTLHNLELSGVSLTRSQKRMDYLKRILLNYGVLLQDNRELVIVSDIKNFAQKQLNLLAAISDANDLYVLSKQTVESVFKEDVQSYLEEQDLIYTPQFISKGSTGLEFSFDFQIAYRRSEIVIKAFNTINKFNLPHFLFTWEDIKKVREKQSGKTLVGLAIINDTDHEVKQELIDALQSKEAELILWSGRYQDSSIQKLKAVNE